MTYQHLYWVNGKYEVFTFSYNPTQPNFINIITEEEYTKFIQGWMKNKRSQE